MTMTVSRNEDHDPGGELENRKWCRTGRHYVPLSRFSRNRHAPDGLDWECRDCHSARDAMRRRDENGLTKRERDAAERRENVRRLHEQGFQAKEIAERLGINQSTVYNDVKAMGINVTRNGRETAHQSSVDKTLDRTTLALTGLAGALDQIQLHDVEIDDENRRAWLKDLDRVATSLNRVRRQLRKGAS
jgi:DNA-binding CsgD family transcriptional regulator